jgi:pSer/pThr/pTyr-binding forkhead associated (FHA) protein
MYASDMQCAVCRQRPSDVGLLCEECRDELSGPVYITPEQVLSSHGRPTGALLIDLWGRPHALDARTLIGRQLEGTGVSVHEGSISRHHAHLAYDPPKKAWTLRDLGSANGTFYNDQPVHGAITVRHGDRVGVGQVGFYFLERADYLPIAELDPAQVPTLRSASRVLAATVAPPLGMAATTHAPVGTESGRTPSGGNRWSQTARTITTRLDIPVMANTPIVEDSAPTTDFDDDEHTDVGLPELEMRLHEPTGGGGGVVEVTSKQVQLTATQFELFSLLVRRMVEESHQPDLVRGFVRTSELIGDLSWDTRDPGDNHVKQLVRRVRRALIKSDIGDLIESRHRFGYRLRVVPRLS